MEMRSAKGLRIIPMNREQKTPACRTGRQEYPQGIVSIFVGFLTQYISACLPNRQAYRFSKSLSLGIGFKIEKNG